MNKIGFKYLGQQLLKLLSVTRLFSARLDELEGRLERLEAKRVPQPEEKASV